MSTERTQRLGATRLALFFALVLAGGSSIQGQEPGFLGRIFRQAGNAGTQAPAGRSGQTEPVRPEQELLPLPAEARGLDRPGTPPLSPVDPSPKPGWNRDEAPASPRLLPQPRVSRAATESDPVVTRVTIGRSDDGQSFGMFLQVFADGTVIDSAGVHALGRESLRGLLGALDSGDPFRQKGHCGGPPTDFVEQVHLTVFERSLGRLRANSFSFSGNTRGCDPSVQRIQEALDALQARISPEIPASAGPTVAPIVSPPDFAPAPLPPPIRLNEGASPG